MKLRPLLLVGIPALAAIAFAAPDELASPPATAAPAPAGSAASSASSDGIATPDVPDTIDLKTAMTYALENNFAIRQARERIEEQEGVILEIRSLALPNVGIGGSYSRFDRDLSEAMGPGAPPAAYQDWQVAIEVRQALYSGGGIGAALEAQKYSREAALLDLQSIIDEVLLLVRIRYYDVLLSREQIDVQEQNIALLEEQLGTSRNRFEAGSVSQFEVLRSEVAVANAKPALIRARNRYRTSIDALRQVLGYFNPRAESMRKVPEFLGELSFQPVAYDLEAALAAALDNRPEVKRLDAIRRAREAGVDSAISDYRPSLDLVAGYQARKSSFSNRVDDSLHGWVAGVEGRWAIFDGNATRGRVRQARSQLEQARLAAAEQRLDIEVEVRRALSSLQEATELAEAAVRVVEQAEEALRLADARYAAGAATQLDVLEARVALTQARDNQLEANYSYLVAVATLRKAIGESDRYEFTQ